MGMSMTLRAKTMLFHATTLIIIWLSVVVPLQYFLSKSIIVFLIVLIVPLFSADVYYLHDYVQSIIAAFLTGKLVRHYPQKMVQDGDVTYEKRNVGNDGHGDCDYYPS